MNTASRSVIQKRAYPDLLFLKKYIPYLYFAFLFFIVFVNNNNVSLWDQDEAAYAGFAKNMVETGDWSIPQFMWSEIHRKPPLHFWNICLSYKLFGINEFSVRFPSALFTFFTYILIYFAGTPLFGKKTAFISVVVLSTSLLVPSLAKVSVTDAALLFFTTLCSFALIYIMRQRSLRWTIIFWISFSLAILTKGPPIVICLGVFGSLLLLLHPNRKNLISLHPWLFLPLACLPLFLWGYYVSQKDGGTFIKWMIDWYVLKRVGGSVLGQSGPPGTHIVCIFLFFITYFMFLPKALWKAGTGIFKKERGLEFILSAWFISGWFLFELTPSKLPTYVVTAHVPLAILIAESIVSSLDQLKFPAKGMIKSHIIILILVFSGFFAVGAVTDAPVTFKYCFFAAAILLTASTFYAAYKFKDRQLIIGMIAINVLLQFCVWTILLPQADLVRNTSKRIAEYINDNAMNSSTIYISNSQGHPPSLPFYLSLNFKNIREENNIERLLKLYKDKAPCVLILEKNQNTWLKVIVPDALSVAITGRYTDRNACAEYYIMINKAAIMRL